MSTPTQRLPFVLVGDGPADSTGLARIARDLMARLHQDFGDQLDLLQIGGPAVPVWRAWPVVPMSVADRRDDWGAGFVEAVYKDAFGDRPGVLWTIWDPGRIYPYLGVDLPVSRWAYPAVDATNVQGTISGPGAEALARFDRVIAYGRWASQVIKPLRGDRPVPYLPHGIDLATYGTPATVEEGAWVRAILGPQYKRGQRVVGVVATNQPRKDWGLALQALRGLIDRGHAVFGWLHVDQLVKDWSLPGLIQDLGLQESVRVTGWDQPWSDRQLAVLYQAATVTIAPGLGEGFGYPIVESLACGTPVVHVDHAGGRELIPKREWRFPVRELRLESVYGLRRPVCRAEDVANAIERVWDWEERVGPAAGRAYLQGSVAHLGWDVLWPRWASWVRQGLEA